MPNINYETEYQLKRNISTQQELEKLKKEVYLEGLQVEEEGLTDVLRKKIKQAINVEDQDSKRQSEKLLNEAIVSFYFKIHPRTQYKFSLLDLCSLSLLCLGIIIEQRS